MIRDAILRHTGAGQARELPGAPMAEAGMTLRAHASHGMLAVIAIGDGECVIEPSVRCDHCGYCKSVGY